MMKDAALPIVLIVLGAIWLLDSLDWLPSIQWVWIFGLICAGSAILALDGITKSSVVAGPMLILAGVLSYFRQFHALGWRFIFPVMLISAGLLMLLARSTSIPESPTFNRRLNHHIRRNSQDGESHD
jgi:hypothetical protein